MKIRNQARLCWAVSDFEPQIMLSICFELSLSSPRLAP